MRTADYLINAGTGMFSFQRTMGELGLVLGKSLGLLCLARVLDAVPGREWRLEPVWNT